MHIVIKKYVTICILIVCVLLIVISCSRKEGNDEMSIINENHKDGEIIVFSMDSSTMKKFIKNPTISTLQSKSLYTAIYSKLENVYRDSHNDADIEIREQIISKNPVLIHEAGSGWMRIGTLPVYTEFIEYVGSITNIQQLLTDEGVVCTVDNYILIEPYASNFLVFPVTIWAQTNIGNYFISIGEERTSANDPHRKIFNYKVYTQEGFYKRVSTGIKEYYRTTTMLIIAGMIIGATAGAAAGGYYSFRNYGGVKWQYVIGGAVIVGVVGGLVGGGVGQIIEIANLQNLR